MVERFPRRDLAWSKDRNQRAWLRIAAVAISVALVLMLTPQGHAGNRAAWLAILPVLFVGLRKSREAGVPRGLPRRESAFLSPGEQRREGGEEKAAGVLLFGN